MPPRPTPSTSPTLLDETPRWSALLDDDLFRPLFRVDAGRPTFRAFVRGEWVETPDTLAVRTPIDGSIIAHVPNMGATEVDAAVDAADAARRSIRSLPGTRRIDLFQRAAAMVREHRAALEDVLLMEAGKPLHDRRGEVEATADRLNATQQEATRIYGEYLPGDWARDTVGKMALVIREPLGIVGCIGPFNYPLFIPTAKVTPALLAGNTVVAKASHQTPLALLLLARVLQSAGLPAGAMNVLTGAGSTAGEALVQHPKVRMVSFTGSTEVGRRIHASSGLKRLHLELGGKGHALVFDDADIGMAAAKCVEGAFKNAGQRCDAVSVAVVDRAVAEAFAERAVKAAQDWRMGDPRRDDTRVGPLISEDAAKRVEAMVRDAADRGARIVQGGRRLGGYVEPTVVVGVTPTMRLAREETFGPVLPILEATNTEDVLGLATATPYGLDSCVFTKSFNRMWRAAKRLDCGEVTVNDLPKHGVGHFPFGGQRESGLGREGIGYSIEEMTELKTIVFNLGPRDVET